MTAVSAVIDRPPSVSGESSPAPRTRRSLRMPRSQVRVGVLLGGILVVAFLLRFLGTRFGFPLLLHPDEPTVVQGAIDMARRNSFEPPYALRPDHVEMKLDYIAFAIFAVIKGAPA